jgi:catechol 2,3-dioxygenase-like lactoylglutathione lyase family enzyme
MLGSANTTVMVDDLDRAIAFYVDTVGLAAGPRYGAHYAEVHASGVTIGLHSRRPGDDTGLGDGNLSIGFVVDGIDDVVAELTRAGVAFTSQENDANRFAFFRDPDGTPLYLFEPKALERQGARHS